MVSTGFFGENSSYLSEHSECNEMAELSKSVQQVFDLMPRRLRPEQTEGIDAIIQMDLEGDEGGQWCLIISEGVLTVSPGVCDNPNMTMTMASGDWLDIANGVANSMGLFMSGKIRISGDMQLAIKMQSMFRFSDD